MTADPSAPVPVDELGYAAAAAELDDILERLDQDTVDVDDLARQVRRAAELVRHCRSRITAARVEVERVVGELADLAEPDPADDD
jgi:exodeoxyribonuclease VII small subunit